VNVRSEQKFCSPSQAYSFSTSSLLHSYLAEQTITCFGKWEFIDLITETCFQSLFWSTSFSSHLYILCKLYVPLSSSLYPGYLVYLWFFWSKTVCVFSCFLIPWHVLCILSCHSNNIYWIMQNVTFFVLSSSVSSLFYTSLVQIFPQ